MAEKQEAGSGMQMLGVEVVRRLTDAFFANPDTIAIPRGNVELVVLGILPEVLRMVAEHEITDLGRALVGEELRDPPLTDWQISRLIELIDAHPHEEELGLIRGVLSEALRLAKEAAMRGKRP